MAGSRDNAEFMREADKPQAGLMRECLAWLSHNKKWWLAPILLGLVLIGVLVVTSGTAVAPFIYTLF